MPEPPSKKYPSLPILQGDRRIDEPQPSTKNSVGARASHRQMQRRAAVVHAGRLTILVLVFFGFRALAQSRSADAAAALSWQDFPISSVHQWFPSATTAVPRGEGEESWVRIEDDQGQNLGSALKTLPAAAKIVGYAGPSNTLIVVDGEGKISGVRLLDSRDTQEHVASVLASQPFWDQFVGLSWGDSTAASDRSSSAATGKKIDTVSGATLTSLAIAQGIHRRLAGGPAQEPIASARFPQLVTLSEAQVQWPDANAMEQDRPRPGIWSVRHNADQLGWMIPTAPLSDTINGFQGPTDWLVYTDSSGTVLKVRLRTTFDNQPYVRYVDEDRWFWKAFVGRSISELAAFDLKNAGVEGVSGATMTSLAAAETIVAAAQRLEQLGGDEIAQAAEMEPAAVPDRLAAATDWLGRIPQLAANRWKETLTIVLAIGGVAIGFGSWRNRAVLRGAWQWILFIVLGFVCGNLLSLATLSGWLAGGLGWFVAPGLAVIALVSLAIPAVTKNQVYCSHLCPHGAAQQFIRRREGRTWKVHRRVDAALRRLPGLILVLAIAMMLTGGSFPLARLEPFDGYLLGQGNIISLILLVGSLAISYFIPMSYCRYGCPTGRFLEYLRFHPRRGKLEWMDFGLIAAALWLGIQMF